MVYVLVAELECKRFHFEVVAFPRFFQIASSLEIPLGVKRGSLRPVYFPTSMREA